MDRDNLIIQTKKKIEEADRKLLEIKEKIAAERSLEQKPKIEAILNDLQNIKYEIEKQYADLGHEKTKDEQVSEIEKNIFNSAESFEEAFTRAGTIFNAGFKNE